MNHIYIVQRGDHVDTNIYKIGRSDNVVRRFKEYNQHHKNSKLIYSMNVHNMLDVERNIIQQMTHIGKIRRDIGNEYIETELHKLILFVNKLCIYNILTNANVDGDNDIIQYEQFHKEINVILEDKKSELKRQVQNKIIKDANVLSQINNIFQSNNRVFPEGNKTQKKSFFVRLFT